MKAFSPQFVFSSLFFRSSSLIFHPQAADSTCGFVEAVDLEAGEAGGIVQFADKASVNNCRGKVRREKMRAHVRVYIYIYKREREREVEVRER